MKKNDFVQIKGLDLEQLRTKLGSLRKEVANLVLDKNMKKLKDLKMIFKKKKEIAQIITLMKQRELLENLEAKLKEGKQ